MKRVLILFILVLLAIPLHSAERKMIRRYNSITKTWASFPLVTIHDIQFNSPESLAVCDSVQAVGGEPISSRWTAQVSPYMNDTVVVEVAVLAPYHTITYTQHGWTMLARDTAKGSSPWNTVLVRVGSTGGIADTVQAAIDGFKNVEKGDIIRLTGRVEEFPAPPGSGTPTLNSVTQLRPIPGITIDIENSGYQFPPPPTRLITDFYHGAYSVGVHPYHVNYTNGEPWEGSYVVLKGLTVTSIINAGRQTWNMVDNFGNQISEYDASYNFAITSGETPPTNPDTSVTHFHVPPIGAVIDSIKGFITIASGGENSRGYRICPLFVGDVSYGTSKPLINTHRRYPVAPKSTDSVTVQAHVTKVAGGLDIGSVHLIFSTNGGAWIDHPMTLISLDSTYQGFIIDPDGNPFPANTAVRYYIRAYDVGATSQILANSSSAVGSDTTQGYFFFTVLDRPLTIHDIQYTPYPNGRSGYLGGVVSVSGIVTADSSDINRTPGGPLSQYATTCWYIQSGNAPWSGIWVSQRDSATGASLSAMRRGDSVTVTGTVQEQFEVTRIYDSLVTITSSGHPVPAPVDLATNSFDESYESMLVRVKNTVLQDTGAVFPDTYEYSVDDGSGSLIVRRDGFAHYSNIDADTTGGYKILHNGDKMDTITGIAYFSHSRWKVIPRKDPDITAGEPYVYRNGWNMVSLGRDQIPVAGYAKSTLYPGAVSNAFYYNGAYTTATTIESKKGYWVKFPSLTTIRQLGRKRTNDTVNVVVGWNLIGTIGNAVPTNTITISPPTNHFSSFYEYTGTYAIQDSLLPSKGLWVKASQAGYFIQSASSMMFPKTSDQAAMIKKNFNTLTVSDNEGHSQILYFGEDREGKLYLPDFELPPAPMEGGDFDVRYSSGRIVEAYPKEMKGAMEYGISVSADRAPLTLSWKIVSPDGKRFLLSDGSTSKVRELTDQGSMTIGKSGTLTLKVGQGVALPKVFALGQNYPNPFNPSTKFQVSLPQDAHLEIVIYNILGQKVATVANEVLEAGYHTLVWNGTNESGSPAATGIYFMRMSATATNGSGESFTAVKKLMMMK